MACNGPNHSASALASHADTWAVGIGLSWYPQATRVAVRLPVAPFNALHACGYNGSFLVDTNNSTALSGEWSLNFCV